MFYVARKVNFVRANGDPQAQPEDWPGESWINALEPVLTAGETVSETTDESL